MQILNGINKYCLLVVKQTDNRKSFLQFIWSHDTHALLLMTGTQEREVYPLRWSSPGYVWTEADLFVHGLHQGWDPTSLFHRYRLHRFVQVKLSAEIKNTLYSVCFCWLNFNLKETYFVWIILQVIDVYGCSDSKILLTWWKTKKDERRLFFLQVSKYSIVRASGLASALGLRCVVALRELVEGKTCESVCRYKKNYYHYSPLYY